VQTPLVQIWQRIALSGTIALSLTGVLATEPAIATPIEHTCEGKPCLSPKSIISRAQENGPPAVTVPSPTRAIADFPSFNSQRLDQQLELYARYLELVGPPDVLIVGSSRSLQGIDPVILQEALTAQGYPDVTIYNFSINGATAQVIDLVVREILHPDHLPQLLIWGDGSRAFNSARQDITYNGIVASQGYRRLVAGDRPIPPIPEPAALPATLPAALTEQGICRDLPAYLVAGEGIISPPAQNFTGNVIYHGYWPHLPCNPPAEAISSPAPLPPVDVAQLPGLADLTALGFQTVGDRFNPSSYYRQYPRVPGQYDANYTSFRLDGVQLSATRQLMQYARTQDLPVVFVNLPLTQDYLDPVRQRYEDQFRQHIQSLANQEGFLVLDLLDRWPTQNNYFADPSHLNRHGAEAVAHQLAIAPLIPWSTLKQTPQEF
jgi:lysophospholipase L1-like esterase